MRRIRRGWALTRKSWALLNGHRELIRFPLYGGVATVLLGILLFGPGFFFLDEDSYGAAIPFIVVGIYVLSVVGTYFSVGLAAAARRRRSPTGSRWRARASPRSAAGRRSRPPSG